MEPERDIEKLLRSYANQRREQAGAPLELQPAAREFMQNEIARRAPRARKASWLADFLSGRWIEWAIAGGLAAATVFTALLLYRQTDEKSPAQLAYEQSPYPMAAHQDAGDGPVLLLESDSAEPGSGHATSALGQTADSEERSGGGRSSPEATRESSLAAIQPTAPEPEQHGSDTSDFYSLFVPALTEAADAEGSTLLAGTHPGLALAPDAAGSKGYAAPVQGKAEAADALAAVTQRFVQAEPGGNAGTGKPFEWPMPPIPKAVLGAFVMEQEGNEIRVVDGDGSVYRGAFQDTANGAQSAGQTSVLLDSKRGVQQESRTGAAQNYGFQVSGTNRSLNQMVVFNGNLITDQPLMPVVARKVHGIAGGPVSAPTMPQLPLSRARISGVAIIDETRAIPIEAVPAFK